MKFGLMMSSALALSIVSSSAFAAEKMGIGADAEFALPVGNLSDAAGIGFGALGKFNFNLNDNLSLTGRLGFVYHLAKDFGGISVGISYVPVRAGVKYFFMGNNDGVYAGGEAGVNYLMTHVSSSVPGLSGLGGDSSLKFGLGVGGGYQLGKLDFRGGLNFLDVGHFGDSIVIALNVGYRFVEL